MPEGSSKPCPFMTHIVSTKGHFIRVDPEFWLTHSGFVWKVKKGRFGYYAYRSYLHQGKYKIIFMHREVLKTKPGFFTHHINHDTLDNRKVNLVEMTQQEHESYHQTLRISKIEKPIFR